MINYFLKIKYESFPQQTQNTLFPMQKRLYINGLLQLSVNLCALLFVHFAFLQKDYVFLSTWPTPHGGWKSNGLLFAVMHHWQEEWPCWQYFAVTFASTASLPSLWSMKTDFDLIYFISDHILPWGTQVQPIIVIVARGAEFVPFLTIQYVIHEPELNPTLLS